MTAKQRADSKRPHRILTLDGGGIRGAMTVEVLAKVEKIAQDKGYETLSDYFDYIAGTSTGAILATGLSLGWSVDKLRDFYQAHGEAMFDKAFLLRLFHYKYDDDNLRKVLQKQIGNLMLGTPKLKTLLMLVMRNATTDSPWPISNNPYAKYNLSTRPDRNTDIPLWQLVRASTAAPTFFPPESVKIGEKNFIFVDGGITSYNNPAFQTFLMATSEPYNLNWQTGEDQMLLVSIGTGSSPVANAGLLPGDMNLLYNATTIPSALMFAAASEQDLLCRLFGNCLSGAAIDREIGDMCSANGSLCGGPVKDKLFTYVRYNAELTQPGLQTLGLGKLDAKQIQKMDCADNLPDLQKIGRAVAKQSVQTSHFERF